MNQPGVCSGVLASPNSLKLLYSGFAGPARPRQIATISNELIMEIPRLVFPFLTSIFRAGTRNENPATQSPTCQIDWVQQGDSLQSKL